MSTTDLTDPPRSPKRRRAQKIGLWSLFSTAIVVALLGLGVLLIIGQTMTAPEWFKARVEARIERNLNGLQIDFGDVEFVINEGWRPRVRLRNVTLSQADGRKIAELADAEASLAMRPLLRGQVQPRTLLLRGASAILRRDAQGDMTLTFDQATAPLEQAAGLTQLVQQIDALFLQPTTSALNLIELDALTIQYQDVRAGQAWTVDGGFLSVTRDRSDIRMTGNFSILSGRDNAATLEFNYSSQLGAPSAEFGINITDLEAQDFARQSIFPAFAWLDALRAPVSGALRGRMDETGSLGLLNVTLQIGEGVLQPTDETRPIPFESVRTYFTYDPPAELLTFDELNVKSAWANGTAEGEAYLGGLSDGGLTDLMGQVRLTRFNVNPSGLYDTPLTLSGAEADIRLTLNPFALTIGRMEITDQGQVARLQGMLGTDAAGWTVALDGEMDGLTPERLIRIWPEAAIPKTRKWIADNLSGGQLSDINFALRTQPGSKPDVYLDFDYADAQIRFVKTMPPITGATGQASLIRDRFVTSATAGQIRAESGGILDIAGTSFIIPDVSVKKGAPALVRLMGRGEIPTVLSLLNSEPLKILEKSELSPEVADGQLDLTGTLALPLKERVELEDVEFHAAAIARDVRSDALIPDKELTADRLSIQASDKSVSIAGEGAIDAVPFEAQWSQELGPDSGASRVTGTAQLSPATLDALEIGLPPGTLSGQATAQFEIDLVPGVPAELALTSNLAGLGISISELDWSKSPGARGTLNVQATLGENATVNRLSLNAAGLQAEGQATTRADGGLERAQFSSIRLGNWLNARAELIGRGKGQQPDVRILGGALDLRAADLSINNRSSETSTMLVALDRLQVTDTIALTDFRGEFVTGRGVEGPFNGRINGGTVVSGRVVPQQGRSALRIQATDAGGVFRDAGVLKQARGGEFTLTLLPVGAPGNFDGSLRVTNTRVQDAPAMAALLNAISVVGLLNELAGQGILVGEVAARFRLTPSQITLYESSATGPSIGLSMDGRYDLASQRLNMQGVISPVYLINGIGSVLTRPGEGLIGFNYTLRGTAQQPSVQVNPLSALAPSFLRDLFRAPRPQEPQAGRAPNAPAPGRPERNLSSEGDR